MTMISSRAAAYFVFSVAAISLRSSGCDAAVSSDANDQQPGFSSFTAESTLPLSGGVIRRLQSTASICEWMQTGNDISGAVGAGTSWESGNSVVLSADGSTLAVGEEGSEGRKGQVRILVLNDEKTGWVQLGQTILGETLDDEFGFSVALSSNGGTVAVGADWSDENGENSGQVSIYQYHTDTTEWTQIGSDVNGEASGDYSGASVALSADGTTLAVGSPLNDGNGNRAGHVRVYELVGGSDWMQKGPDLNGEAAGDWDGISVSLSLDGQRVAVGGHENGDNGHLSGHIRVFQYNTAENRWSQVGNDIDGRAAGDNLGFSVFLSADGRTVAAGGPQHDNDSGSATGKNGYAVVYALTADNQWTQLGDTIIGEVANDRFGWSVSLSADGRTLAVGACRNDGKGSDSGHVRLYNLQSDSERWVQVGGDIVGEGAGDWFGSTVSLSADGTLLAVESHNSDDRYASVFTIVPSCMSDNSSVIPTIAPTVLPSETPTIVSTIAPLDTPPPTLSDAANNISTISPTIAPTPTPTDPAANAPTVELTKSPAESPAKVLVDETVIGISVTFQGVKELNGADIESYAEITATWFDDYFNEPSTSQRMLQRSDVSNMTSTVDVTNQNFSGKGLNTITYSQSMKYVALQDAPTPEEYAVLPYTDREANQALGDTLRAEVPGFEGLNTELIVPPAIDHGEESTENNASDNGDNTGDGGLSAGALIGIFVVAGVIVALVTGLVSQIWWKRRRQEGRDEVPIEPAPSHYGTETPAVAIADAETAEALPVDSTAAPNVPFAVVVSPKELPTFKDQVRHARHGSHARPDAPVARPDAPVRFEYQEP